MFKLHKYVQGLGDGSWSFLILKEVTDRSRTTQVLADVYDSRKENRMYPTRDKTIDAADLKIQELTRMNGE